MVLGPFFSCSDLGSREHHRVEGNVILTHELVQADLFRVLPPFLPVFKMAHVLEVVGGNGNISDGSIEPHIQNLLLKLLQRHGSTPDKISGDTSRFQALFQPIVGDGSGILRPTTLDGSLFNPNLQWRFKFVQLEVYMVGVSWDWGGIIELTTRIDQFKRVQQCSTFVTLVTSGIVVGTLRTRALHESVGQEGVVGLAVQLFSSLLFQVSIVVQFHENVASNFGLQLSGGPAKVVEADIEPFIHISVHNVVFVTQLLGSDMLFQSLSLGSGTVLVSTTEKQGVVVSILDVTSIDIGRQHRSNNVT